MRCCRCGGALTGERRIDAEQVADAVENTRASRADAFEDDDQLLGDDAPPQLGDILQFARPGGGPRPARRSQGSRAPW
ncbi:MAG: hypothetical protein IT305_18580 [Chloroflexi bacterium]|nr:hypothetical protein [Chloroflexota bacterium]